MAKIDALRCFCDVPFLPMDLNSFLSSIAVHLIAGATLWASMYFSPPQVAGGAGLRGSPNASLFIQVAGATRVAEAEAPRPQRIRRAATKKIAPAVDEGIPIAAEKLPKLPTELPEKTKAKARVIDDELASRQARAVPSSQAGEVYGTPGQGGTGDRVSARIGNSNRTNAIGLYLSRVHQKVQRSLRSPGILSGTRTAQMNIRILQSGHVDRIEVRKSSGDRKLDQLAIEAIKRAQPFEPAEKELNVNIPVVFRTAN